MRVRITSDSPQSRSKKLSLIRQNSMDKMEEVASSKHDSGQKVVQMDNLMILDDKRQSEESSGVISPSFNMPDNRKSLQISDPINV